MTHPILRSLAAVAGILLVVGGCAAPDANPAASADLNAQYTKLALPAEAAARFSVSGSETVSRVIGPEGGVIENAGHRLVFPAGALAAPTEIRMTPDARYVGVHLEPHGIVFPAGREPVLTLSYAVPGVGRVVRPSVVYVDDAWTVLEALPSAASPSTRSVAAPLTHFSGYLVAGG